MKINSQLRHAIADLDIRGAEMAAALFISPATWWRLLNKPLSIAEQTQILNTAQKLAAQKENYFYEDIITRTRNF